MVRPLKQVKSITLVLNSPWVERNMLGALAENSILIGVDGGLKCIVEAGLSPHWAIGDFDSIDPEILDNLAASTRIFRFPKEKDYTDMELALRLVRSLRPGIVNVLGLGGGIRFDHQLVNSVLLSKLALSGCVVRALGGPWSLQFSTISQVLSAGHGRFFSVFTMTGTAVITLRGAKYSGSSLVLKAGSGYGLGNEISARTALVKVEAGGVIISQWHRE